MLGSCSGHAAAWGPEGGDGVRAQPTQGVAPIRIVPHPGDGQRVHAEEEPTRVFSNGGLLQREVREPEFPVSGQP